MSAALKRRLAKLEERKATKEPAQRQSAIVIIDGNGDSLTPVSPDVTLLITIPDNHRGDWTHGKTTAVH